MSDEIRSNEQRDPVPPHAHRRAFLKRALDVGAAATLGALTTSCGANDPAASASVSGDEACGPTATDAGAPATGPLLDVTASGMPYRQDDPAWGSDLMWDRDLVIRAAHELNGTTLTEARALLRQFDDGNNIANEGCLLTSLAMVLQLLAPKSPAWTPKTLNASAQELYYYTRCGLSMQSLYADLVSEVSEGNVQQCLKEEYLAGVPGWPKTHVHTSSLVRAYRRLKPAERTHFVVMLKTGTYDDTVASHYLLLHPNDAGSADDSDPEVLDPAKPLDQSGVWRLSDSARAITQDPDIAQGWVDSGIEPTQIGGAWVFTRWSATHDRSQLAPLIQAWASELASAR
jgi:hypothetical protein